MLLFIPFITDLMAYDATDRCTADRPESTAPRKDGTADSTGTRTDRRVSILRRHACAAH
jgi:hypothetical protein